MPGRLGSLSRSDRGVPGTDGGLSVPDPRLSDWRWRLQPRRLIRNATVPVTTSRRLRAAGLS